MSVLPPLFTSRRVLLGAAATGALAATIGAAPPASAQPSSLPAVASLPNGAPVRSQFAASEQRFAPYLVILAAMANDIDDTGFMGGGWWRTPNDPGNARIQEHVATLSWFLTQSRPWNPYTGDSALEARLDAAIGHYLSLQQPSGAFPVPNDANSRATTGFGLVALASTYENLTSAGLLPARCAQIATALHDAANWFLNLSGQWTIPIDAVNQTVGGLVGVKMALDLLPNAALSADLSGRIDDLIAHGQSPAGFFYEDDGQDLGYNFDVMMPDLADLYRLTNRTDLLPMMAAFAEWYGYNWVWEPDGSGAIVAGASTTRTITNYYDAIARDDDRAALTTIVRPNLPELSAFFTTSTDRAAVRTDWASQTGPVPGRAKGDTSPRILLHAVLGENYPTPTQRSAAISALPWQTVGLSETRTDPSGQHYVYLRRSRYYLAGFYGLRTTSQVKAGPSLLWHPTMGTLIHSRNDATGRAWATQIVNGASTATETLSHTLSGDTLDYQTSSGSIGGQFSLASSSLVHSVTVAGTSAASHTIPLVIKSGDIVTVGTQTLTYGSSLTTTASKITIKRAGVTAIIQFDRVVPIEIAATTTTYFRSANRRLHLAHASFSGSLTITITLP